jgi:hypothetical protein
VSDTAATAIAVLAALAAAASFGVAAALQHRQARLTPQAGGVRLLARLAARPLWLAGIALAHWQPWALLVLGAAGLLLSASAFQAGSLAASLPVMDTVEPVSGVLFGTLLFGERLAASPAGITMQLTGTAAAIAGITLLGRYAGTPGLRTAAKQAGAITGPGRAAQAGAAR